MANSRIYLTCRHCGEYIGLGRGYFGNYTCSGSEKELGYEIEEFFEKHGINCKGVAEADASDLATNHFIILEEGQTITTVKETETLRETIIESGSWGPKITIKEEWEE